MATRNTLRLQKIQPSYLISPKFKSRANNNGTWQTNVMKLPASIALASKPKWFVIVNKKETTNV